MSANATIELCAADFYRGQASIITDIEKIVQPLLAQQQYVADNDSDIMGLRMQITANINILVKVAPELAAPPGSPRSLHIVTIGNAPVVRALIFTGTATPTCVGDPAATTAGALKNLLKVTQQALEVHFLATPTKAKTTKKSISGTPSKMRTPNPTRRNNLAPVQIKPLAQVKPVHTRVTSAAMAWDSDQLHNPKFDSFGSASTSSDENNNTGYPNTLVNLSFGSGISGDTAPNDSPCGDYVKVTAKGRGMAPGAYPIL